jgi:hypothetical protein
VRDLAIEPLFAKQHKVPPSYSRAEESARSLNGRRDDEIFIVSRDFLGLFVAPAISRRSTLCLHLFGNLGLPYEYAVTPQQHRCNNTNARDYRSLSGWLVCDFTKMMNQLSA